jgi:hypothetical protein
VISFRCAGHCSISPPFRQSSSAAFHRPENRPDCGSRRCVVSWSILAAIPLSIAAISGRGSDGAGALLIFFSSSSSLADAAGIAGATSPTMWS